RSGRTCPTRPSASSRPSGSRSTSPGPTSRTVARRRSPGSSRRSRSFRGSTSPPRRRSVIDTHAHLDALEAPESALDRARAAGVTRVITIGPGLDSCRRALELTAHDGVYAALGIDPHQAATGEAGRVGELRTLLDHPRAIAVGEAGLDYHYGGDAKDEQRSLFSAQLALAASLDLPVVV